MSRSSNAYRRAGYWVEGTGWEVAAAPDPAEPDGLPVHASEGLRWGYTLADVHRIAISATFGAGSGASDVADRRDTAWSAIVERLYSDDTTPPTEADLYGAGRSAIWSEAQQLTRSHGYNNSRHVAMPRFALYWAAVAAVTGGPEEAVVEKTATVQILQQIARLHPKAIADLEHFMAHGGNASAAARALGTYPARISEHVAYVRRLFLRLWHEGETPWRPPIQQPAKPAKDLRPCGTMSAYHRHRYHKERPCEPCRAAWNEYLKRYDRTAVAS